MTARITIDISSETAELLRLDLPTLPKFSGTRALVAELLQAIDGGKA